MTHEEQCGADSLIVVYRHGSYAESNVTRWCQKCGAIVIDVDYDGRTKPGAFMAMQFPEAQKDRVWVTDKNVLPWETDWCLAELDIGMVALRWRPTTGWRDHLGMQIRHEQIVRWKPIPKAEASAS